ncbi:MAG: trypsin-like serine protease, partial [Pseudonocardiaceae bacterium]
ACPQPNCDSGPRYLKQLDTQITYDANCQAAGIDGSSELCVAATTQDTACYGDSGGPALLNSSGRWLLTGATSRSGGTNSTCGADGSVIYTDVAAHRNWISYYLQF